MGVILQRDDDGVGAELETMVTNSLHTGLRQHQEDRLNHRFHDKEMKVFHD